MMWQKARSLKADPPIKRGAEFWVRAVPPQEMDVGDLDAVLPDKVADVYGTNIIAPILETRMFSERLLVVSKDIVELLPVFEEEVPEIEWEIFCALNKIE